VAVADNGKESIGSDPVIAAAIESGWAVCAVDPRGIGESSSAKTGWIFAVSLLLGENFVGRQAFDLDQVIENLGTTDAFAGKPIGLYARGPNASLMAVYAMAHRQLNALERSREGAPPGEPRRNPARTEPRPPGITQGRSDLHRQSPLHWFLLRDGFLSYRAFFERPRALSESFRLMPADGNRTTSFDREIPASFFVVDVLHSWDLPQLLASISAQGLIVNAIDGEGDRLSERAALKLLPRHIRVVSGAEPHQGITNFLRSVLVERGISP
jgi:hypothetical protein